MKLAETLAISGQPGLFRFVAQSRNGIIVESLADAKRMIVSGNAKVSSLNDIAIFTTSEDMPLGRVFEMISKATKGKECCSHKVPDAQLKAAMKQYLPDYDEDRVRVSDIKKLFAWFNILIANGMTVFVEDEAQESADAQPAEDKAAPATKAETTAPKKKKSTAEADSAAEKKPTKTAKPKTADKQAKPAKKKKEE